MTAPRVAGIDLSLTSTGLALPDGTLISITSRQRGIPRCLGIAGEILGHLTNREADGYLARLPIADLIAIEGYSYSSRNSQAHALGELGGIVRGSLHDYDIPWVDISPATVKKYATGRGNAPKDQVLVAAVSRLGITPQNSDEADAAWLRALTLDHYGHPPVAMPKTHRAALDKITWPALQEAP